MREFRCASLGFHCSWRHIAADDLLADMAVLHLREVHGVKSVEPGMLGKIRDSFSTLTIEAEAVVAPGMKEYACDLRPGCGWRYVAMTADLIADGAAVHAREVHGIKAFTPKMAAQVKKSIREWSGPQQRRVA